jgi:jumonji domain-containing protein 7
VFTLSNTDPSDLIQSYNELNSAEVSEIHEEPSALEFMRYVARNRPVIIRNGAQDWTALQKWNLHYLTNAMAGQSVNVAMTPDG